MNFNNFQDHSFLKKAQDNNWEILKFMDVFNDDTRKAVKIKRKDYAETGRYPIVDQSKVDVGGYTDLEDGLYESTPFLIFGDHTRVIKYVDTSSFIGADGVKLLKNKLGEERVKTKYLYYFLKSITIPDTGYNRHFKFLKEVVIPIPPAEVQIKILDTFDKHESLVENYKKQLQMLEALEEALHDKIFRS